MAIVVAIAWVVAGVVVAAAATGGVGFSTSVFLWFFGTVGGGSLFWRPLTCSASPAEPGGSRGRFVKHPNGSKAGKKKSRSP